MMMYMKPIVALKFGNTKASGARRGGVEEKKGKSYRGNRMQ